MLPLSRIALFIFLTYAHIFDLVDLKLRMNVHYRIIHEEFSAHGHRRAGVIARRL